jgi:hypothetical protein
VTQIHKDGVNSTILKLLASYGIVKSFSQGGYVGSMCKKLIDGDNIRKDVVSKIISFQKRPVPEKLLELLRQLQNPFMIMNMRNPNDMCELKKVTDKLPKDSEISDFKGLVDYLESSLHAVYVYFRDELKELSIIDYLHITCIHGPQIFDRDQGLLIHCPSAIELSHQQVKDVLENHTGMRVDARSIMGRWLAKADRQNQFQD